MFIIKMNSGYGLADNLKYNEFVFDSTTAQVALNGLYTPANWPNFYPGKPINNVAAMKIIEVQIPFTNYIFNERNNTFHLLESPTGFAIPLTVTIPVGNYTADNFCLIVGEALTRASAGAGGSNAIYSAAFDFPTSKLTYFTTNGGSGFYFKFYMKSKTIVSDPNDTHPGPFIGFNDGQVYTSTTALFTQHVTTGGTTILTVTSTPIQVFEGTIFSHTVKLPTLTSTFGPGDYFEIYNTSNETLTIIDFGDALISAQATLTRVVYSVNAAGTAWIVGPDVAYTGSAIPPATQAYLQAPNMMQLSGPNFIYLCSKALGPLVKLFLPNEQVKGMSMGANGPEVTKIPISVNSGSVIYWQDPDPNKWFDMDGLQGFPSIDFYCSSGTGNESRPVDFNGLGFSIKMGVLLADANVSTFVGGSAGGNRVSTRSWQPGSLF